MHNKRGTPPSAYNRPARSAHWCHRVVAGFFLMAALTASAQSGQPSSSVNTDKPSLVPTSNSETDANRSSKMESQQVIERNAESIDLQRRRQLAEDSARLLQLATELKFAVDNSDQHTLSVHIVRKAESIAKLAHGVKEEMKQNAAQHGQR